MASKPASWIVPSDPNVLVTALASSAEYGSRVSLFVEGGGALRSVPEPLLLRSTQPAIVGGIHRVGHHGDARVARFRRPRVAHRERQRWRISQYEPIDEQLTAGSRHRERRERHAVERPVGQHQHAGLGDAVEQMT